MPQREALPSLAVLTEVVDGACALVRELLAQPWSEQAKTDASPVTSIDLAIDAWLHQHLRPLAPTAGWLSEETADDPSRLERELLWLVDPIDGTRSLVAGLPEFCVSVALWQAGVGPRLAVIGNPSTGEQWRAELGQGAFDRQDRRLQVTQPLDLQRLRLLVSRSDHAHGWWRGVVAEEQMAPAGSLAFKLALVASGRYDGHATPTPRAEWDAAAGALILAEAGGKVTDAAGRALTFNQPSPTFAGVVAASAAAFPRVLALAQASAHQHGHGPQASVGSKFDVFARVRPPR
jgi:myo-inositol-1(or 4)-monophosphatase